MNKKDEKYKGEIFSHVHKAIDELLPRENTTPKSLLTVSWVNDAGQTITIDIERAFGLANLSDREMRLVIKVLVPALVMGDRVSLLTAILYLIGSLSVSGKARKDIIEVISHSEKKIQENVMMERIKKLAMGGLVRKENEAEEEELEEDVKYE